MNSTTYRITRRSSLRLSAMAAVGAFGLPITSCSNRGALIAWDPAETPETDPRWHGLSRALLAPSPHNTQPWSVALRGKDCVELYVDRSRTIPAADPELRQIYIAQGGFLELLMIALRELRYQPKLTLFPDGENGPGKEPRPVARVDLGAQKGAADELAAYVFERRSNKRAYDMDKPPSAEALKAFSASHGVEGVHCSHSLDSAKVKELSQLAHCAVKVDMDDPARYAEMLHMFRFDEEEREKCRDGFGLPQTGMSGLRLWMAETFFISRDGAQGHNSDFAKEGIELAAEQTAGTPVWGWLMTEGNDRSQQIAAGRAYVRLSLQAARMGLAQHPMSQLLQEYPAMTKLQRSLYAGLGVARPTTVQMFYRLGYADPTRHSPRRPVKALVVANSPVAG